jgi:DNA-damage-inducible protein D
MDNQLTRFEGTNIRKVWQNDEWFFAVTDIIQILVETASPRQYWTKVKNRLSDESQLQPFWLQLKMIAPDGKNRLTDCANTEGVFRMLMAVPSPKAEPFKLWLASLGKQALDETENPELGIERVKDLYKSKGYPNDWISTRLKSIDIRKELTDEWQGRGVKEGQEFAILTAQIAKETFGLTPSEHKDLKGLERQNLRDHMTNLELIFTMLGEESTRQIAVEEDALGFEDNLDVAYKGGKAAGLARKQYEKNRNVKVVSPKNFLKQIEDTQKTSLSEGDENTPE